MARELFAEEFRMREIDKDGDPLKILGEKVDWELFRPQLEKIHEKKRKSNAGRRPFDVILMFKILILQSLYNLSDDATEFQIKDRLSFMRFLGLNLSSRVPDSKTIWLFRELLKNAEIVDCLFEKFDRFLSKQGLSAKKGSIIDASIVSAPRQRNSRQENQAIKDGSVPKDWNASKQAQKDTEARWVKKNGVNYYGYKNNICIDNGLKFIRRVVVTDAAVHDSQMFDSLIDPGNSSRDVWADAAYFSRERVASLIAQGYRPHLQRKGFRNRPLTEREKRGNRTRAKTRSRVEHVFGVQVQRAATLVIRTIGKARVKTKIMLRNLSYNMTRYAKYSLI